MNYKAMRGFTLLETSIALAIMATGLLLLNTSWSGSFLRLRKTQLAFEAATLLERKMSDVELEYRGKPLTEIPEAEADDFGSDYPNYSWRVTSKEFKFPDLTSAIISQREGGVDSMLLSTVKQMTEAISKSVKEVTVTVIYTGGKKPIEHSITTLFIDYDQNLQFGLPGGG